MPKYTVYKICPYYIDENKKSISCEDCCRSFRSPKAKYKWMNKYCDTWEWEKCPWAIDLTEAYRRYEKGDIKALENHEIEALTKETKYLRTRLGKAEKRVERQQKKIDELRAVNQSFVNRNETLYEKWRKADEDLRAFRNNAADELSAMAEIYEQRFCYLIDTFAPDGVVREDDVKAWAEDKEFALVGNYEAGAPREWKVVFKDAEQDQDIPADV